MIAADHTLRDSAVSHSAAVLRLVDLLRAAHGAQWSVRPGERLTSFAEIKDETAAIATSTSRLRLRASVLTAESALAASTASLESAADALEANFDTHVNPPTFNAASDAAATEDIR